MSTPNRPPHVCVPTAVLASAVVEPATWVSDLDGLVAALAGSRA